MPKKTAPSTLSGHAAEIFEAAYEAAWSSWDPDKTDNDQEAYSMAVAWTAVKNAYKQNDDGEWVKKTILFNLRITKATRTADGVVKWHAQAASDEGREGETELLDPSLFDDLANTFNMIREAIDAEEELPSFGYGPAQEPILDFSHYTADLDPEFRDLARAGLVTQLYRDGRYLHAGGIFDDTELGQMAAQAALDDEEGVIRVSVGFYPDWGNIEVKDDVLYFRGGRNLAYLDHLALTTVPRIPGTTFVAEVTMSDNTIQTAAEDMEAILGSDAQPFIEKIEDKLKNTEQRSMVIRADDDSPVEEIPSEEVPSEPVEVAPVVESVVEAVVEEVPVVVEPVLESEVSTEPVLEAAVVTECDVWKPFGGATSFEDAVAIVNAEKELGRLYDGMYVFEEVLWNIMDDPEVTDKRAAMGKATADFQEFINSDTSLWSAIVARRSAVAEVEVEPVEVQPAPSEPEPQVIQDVPVDEQQVVVHTQSPDSVVEPPEASPMSVVNGEQAPSLKRVGKDFKEILGMMEKMPTQDRRRAVSSVIATTEAELSRAVGAIDPTELATAVATAVSEALAPTQAAILAALRVKPESQVAPEQAPLRRSRAPVPNILPASVTTKTKTFGDLLQRLREKTF